MPKVRFNCEVIPADGEEKQERWLTWTELLGVVRDMKDGDDVVIHAIADLEGDL